MKALVAHTSEALRQEAWNALDRLGWEVVEADDARDAERVCRYDAPDVALVEGSLAWPAGGSLLEHFRRDPYLRTVPVVVLEETLDFDAALSGLEAGAHDFLLEPVSGPELAARVTAAERARSLQARVTDQQAELRDLVHVDPLTGLLDRRFMTRQLSAQVNAARRHGHDLTVLLVDIDRFKAINDALGHAAGDAALRTVGGLLADRLRDTDIAGRWGGDEFLLALPMTAAAQGLRVAEELCAAVRGAEGLPTEVTLSIGCAGWEGDDPSEIVARADLALYEVKREGRDGARLAPERVVEVRPAAAPASMRSDVRPLRVVVADDVEGIRSLVRITLEGSGIEVVGEAENGAEVVDVARSCEPDVVVMDWNMPGTDGLQGTRAVLAEVPSSRVVAFTSTDEPRILRALAEAGAEAHFHKSDMAGLVAYLGELRRGRG